MTLSEELRERRRIARTAAAEIINATDEMADTVVEHIRHVRPATLRRLKAALRRFDAKKYMWRR